MNWGNLLVGLALFFICTATGIYYYKKKREHPDFKSTVIVVIFFGLLGLTITLAEIENYIAIYNKNFQTASGECMVTEFQSKNIHEFHIEVNNEIKVSGEVNRFSNLKEGTYQCTVKYIEKSGLLYEFQSHSDNE